MNGEPIWLYVVVWGTAFALVRVAIYFLNRIHEQGKGDASDE